MIREIAGEVAGGDVGGVVRMPMFRRLITYVCLDFIEVSL